MKNLIYVFVLFFISGCSMMISIISSEHRSWEFMESVGGLNIGNQGKNPNWLIIKGDVSGCYNFSNKSKGVNSGLTTKELECEIKGSIIQIYVVTTLPSDTYPSSRILGVKIPTLKKGEYMVQYLNPDGSVVDLKTIYIF